MKKALAFILSICFLISMCGCSLSKVKLGVLNFEIDSTPKKLDPLLAESFSERQIACNIFEGLYKLDENSAPILCCAESCDISENGTIYTFKLKEGLMWSDKKPLTANDFAFGLKRALLPETNSPYAHNLFGITGAEAVNKGLAESSSLGIEASSDKILIIRLDKADADFPVKLCSLAAMPCRQDFFESCGGRYGLATKYLICNAAYYVRTWQDEYTDKSVVLSQSSSYKGDFKASLEKINISFGDTEGRIDRLQKKITTAAVASGTLLGDAHSAEFTSLTYQKNCSCLILNPKNQYLGELSLRQALAKSFDRTAYSAFLPEYLRVAEGIVPDASIIGTKLYNEDRNSPCVKYDADEAGALFETYISSVKGILPSFTLIYTDANLKTALSVTAQTWQKLFGIYVELKEVSESELYSAVSTGKYDMAIYPFTPDDLTVYSALDDFTSGGSFSDFASDEYDELFKEASQTQDNTQAADIYFSAESNLLSYAAVIPVAFQLEGFVATDDITAMKFFPMSNILDFTATTVKFIK